MVKLGYKSHPKIELLKYIGPQLSIAFSELTGMEDEAMLFEAIARKSPDVVNSAAHREADEGVSRAKALHKAGDEQAALIELSSVITLLETLSTQRPLQAREERRYLSLFDGLPYFQAAYMRHHQEAVEREGAERAFGYDAGAVDLLIEQAAIYADNGRYGEASVLLRAGQEQVAEAIKGILNHTQVGVVAYTVSPSIVLGRSPEEIAEEEYQEAVLSIKHFREAHKRQHNVESFEVVGYDSELVDWLLAEAAALADDGRHQAGLKVVAHVRTLITKALRDTLNGQEIIVEFDISTPELEFAYEHRRYQGYEELIPIAVERMRPDLVNGRSSR